MITALAVLSLVLATALGVFHLMFSSIFRWKPLLAAMDPVNRGILLALNFSIASIAFLVAGLAGAIASGLLPIDRGARVTLVGIGLFLTIRAGMQPIYFSMANPASRLFLALVLVAAASQFALAAFG
jgi:hypothetical protein